MTTGQFAQQIGVSIQKITPFTASVALGHKFNDLALFGNMKNELLTLLQFRMIQGGNRVFQAESFHDIKIQKSKGISSSILKYTEQVITSFAQGKRLNCFRHYKDFSGGRNSIITDHD